MPGAPQAALYVELANVPCAVIAAGAGVAAVTDLTFSLDGYTALVLKDLLTALHIILGTGLGFSTLT